MGAGALASQAPRVSAAMATNWPIVEGPTTPKIGLGVGVGRINEATARKVKQIGVNYVFFPLDIHPGADKKAEAVWCSSDRKATYTAAMSGQDPGKATCKTSPVAETKALAISIGIDSTPTVLAEDGTHVNGSVVMNPDQLLAELDRLAAKPSKVASN